MVLELKIKSKVMEVGNSYAVVIPKIIRDNYVVEKGDEIEIIVDEDGLCIKLRKKK